MKANDRLLQSRKQSASCSNRASDSGRLRPQRGTGRVVLRTSPPGASSGTSGRSRLVELDERALAPRSPKRPAETRVQPAGVRRAAGAGIGDFDGDCERVGAQPVVDRKRERERIDRTRARIVAQGKPHKVRP